MEDWGGMPVKLQIRQLHQSGASLAVLFPAKPRGQTMKLFAHPTKKI